jgi:hypothetical protein
MPALPENFAPYAPADNVLDVIKQFRNKGLPEVLNATVFDRLGIPPGNVGRVSQTLRFLGLIDEEGRRTEKFNDLGKASTEQYPEVFANIVRDAYYELLKYVDPVTDSEQRIVDQFRHFEPASVRSRMVSLFIALCREANIIEAAGSRENSEPRPRRVVVGRTLGTPKRNSQTKDETEAKPPVELPHPPLHHSRHEGEEIPHFALLSAVLKQLPKEGKWTEKRRAQWLTAFTSNLDLVIETVEPEPAKPVQGALPM